MELCIVPLCCAALSTERDFGLEVLTPMTIKTTVFWVVMLHISEKTLSCMVLQLRGLFHLLRNITDGFVMVQLLCFRVYAFISRTECSESVKPRLSINHYVSEL